MPFDDEREGYCTGGSDPLVRLDLVSWIPVEPDSRAPSLDQPASWAFRIAASSSNRYAIRSHPGRRLQVASPIAAKNDTRTKNPRSPSDPALWSLASDLLRDRNRVHSTIVSVRRSGYGYPRSVAEGSRSAMWHDIAVCIAFKRDPAACNLQLAARRPWTVDCRPSRVVISSVTSE